MPNVLKTIWITTFTLFAMLSTSLFVEAKASGEALRLLHTQSESQQNVDVAANCPEEQHGSSDHGVKNHQSCSSTCILKMPSHRALSELAYQDFSLAPIPPDGAIKPVLIAQGLYRPPIV
ncbi:hypothetical protein [Vibrio paucivorans]|jgi:hypothetical protein|uniref:DUF2946 domain-containing protein n=1 Tax=Vibrio paucivorans TaxID=2829489 RepID=A0A9X3CJ42_9VIBR|nr:hypothetical protein [Vibrio paucivorans]MCW8336651.1 hypothetical protein [Vibrio paucivorans]